MAEWPIAPVLKTGSPQGFVGSNPTSSDFLPRKAEEESRKCGFRGRIRVDSDVFSSGPKARRKKPMETAAPAGQTALWGRLPRGDPTYLVTKFFIYAIFRIANRQTLY
ncbi:MAG: hypothetical protein RL235_978 [Chlamydiota bacterium]